MFKEVALMLILLTGCTTHPVKETAIGLETASAAELAASVGTAPTPRMVEMPVVPAKRQEMPIPAR
jgi:hypothetical protein